MTSAQMKNFLINLLIAILLAVPIMAGIYYFRDKIEYFFTRNKSQNPQIVSKNGPFYKVSTSDGKKEALSGTVTEIFSNAVTIDRDNRSQKVIIDEQTLIFQFDASLGDVGAGLKERSLPLGKRDISDVLEVDSQVDIPEVERREENYVAKILIIFPKQ